MRYRLTAVGVDGFIRERGATRIYGSGLISSHGDAANALGPHCDRQPFSLDAVIAQPFEIDRLQDLLFVVDSVDQLFEATEALARILVSGRPAARSSTGTPSPAASGSRSPRR